MGDQHAELGTPITNVVHSHHIVAAELKNTAQSISNNGRAQVTHVHFLGDIRRGEINQDLLLGETRRADALGQRPGQGGHNGAVGNVDIDESIGLNDKYKC